MEGGLLEKQGYDAIIMSYKIDMYHKFTLEPIPGVINFFFFGTNVHLFMLYSMCRLKLECVFNLSLSVVKVCQGQ